MSSGRTDADPAPPSRIRLSVNGEAREVPARPDRSLLLVLRTELGLTGTKYGCGEGECGSCTVLLGDEAARACQVRVGEVGGRPVTTIEGLARDGELTPVQRAFAETGAFQCGYCTPGIIMRLTALSRGALPTTPEELRRALEGNLCRCCGYSRILGAAQRALAVPGTAPHR